MLYGPACSVVVVVAALVDVPPYFPKGPYYLMSPKQRCIGHMQVGCNRIMLGCNGAVQERCNSACARVMQWCMCKRDAIVHVQEGCNSACARGMQWCICRWDAMEHVQGRYSPLITSRTTAKARLNAYRNNCFDNIRQAH